MYQVGHQGVIWQHCRFLAGDLTSTSAEGGEHADGGGWISLDNGAYSHAVILGNGCEGQTPSQALGRGDGGTKKSLERVRQHWPGLGEGQEHRGEDDHGGIEDCDGPIVRQFNSELTNIDIIS